MSKPHSLALMAFILVSLSTTGIFFTEDWSFTVTCSCSDAIIMVCASNKSLFAPAISATLALARMLVVIQAEKVSSLMFCPGCPCAYASVPSVCS